MNRWLAREGPGTQRRIDEVGTPGCGVARRQKQSKQLVGSSCAGLDGCVKGVVVIRNGYERMKVQLVWVSKLVVAAEKVHY